VEVSGIEMMRAYGYAVPTIYANLSLGLLVGHVRGVKVIGYKKKTLLTWSTRSTAVILQWLMWFELTGVLSRARRAESRRWCSWGGCSEPNPHQRWVWGSAASTLSGVRSGAPQEVCFGAFWALKITNFNDFAFMLGMTVFDQVGLKSQHGGKPEQVGLSLPCHRSL